MIAIVAHFCAEVVKFIFDGRNSGQSAQWEDVSVRPVWLAHDNIF
jgi:hypothetical protein